MPILAEVGSDRNLTRFSLAEHKGGRALDIRSWYRDKSVTAANEDPYIATKKGIWLNAQRLKTLREILRDQGERIDAWISGREPGNAPPLVERRQNDARQARESLIKRESTTTATNRDYFFEVKHEGGRATVQFSDRHTFRDSVEQVASDNLALDDLLTDLLASFDRACRAVDQGAEQVTSDAQLEQLQFYWAFFLSKYLKDHRSPETPSSV